ncbi:hypothetical protein [Sphingomonas sp.]|uniref:hypothetical protein n=1 Tax=Sphingomonas sp. TaxID=28214 RepID=UPI0028B0EECE|nr:hypothetical protein [Sphingomonas sp.]
MKAALSRALLRLAAACLGERKSDWALAMEAELEMAITEGQPMKFAFGCLLAAGRGMFTAEEGSFVLTSYTVAIGLLLPMAALQIGCALFGLPYLYPGRHGLVGAMIDGGLQASLLRGVYQAAIPSLALLQLLIGLGQLRIAWLVLERDWAAVLRWGSLSLAASATLVMFLSVLFIDGRQALLQGAVLAIELATIASLARWYAHFSPGPAPTSAR